MNDELDDRRLRKAIRGALSDIVAASPSAGESPRQHGRRERPATYRRRWVHVAAGLTAAAGLIGVVAIANRDDGPPAVGEPSSNDAVTTASSDIATPATATTVPTTASAPATSSTEPVAAASVPAAGECGDAQIPAAATNVESIAGDIDGDAVDDTVTLYAVGNEWRVHVTSSVRLTSSDTSIFLTLGDHIASAAVTLADIDMPEAILVTAEGPNDLGITANFTFLTLNPDYCVGQWIYRNAQGVDEPFEWVALREPGHVTGMICQGEPGSRTYRLVDSEQDADGTWQVIDRILTHDFTRAEISFPPAETVPDSPDFVDQYGSILGC